MCNAEQKIAALGWELVPSIPKANYVASVRTGNLLFLSGALPIDANGKMMVGKLGADCTDEQGYEAARLCVLSLLGSVKHALGSLDNVKQIVKITGLVNSTPDYTKHSMVVNGASDALYEFFGPEVGKHTRVAAGWASLPFGVPTEVEMILEIKDSCDAA